MTERKCSPPQKIVISHVYSSDNKGDAALTSVLIQDIKRQFPKASITILTLDATTSSGQFEGIPEQPAFMYYALNKSQNPLVKLEYTLYMLAVTLMWATWLRYTRHKMYLPRELREVAGIYATTDLIVTVGGGYIRSRKGFTNRLNIPLILHPLLFGWLIRKPTVLYPQSVGPFVNSYEKSMVAFVLKRMTLIILREDKSLALLSRLGVTKNVVRSIDSGFLLQGTKKQNIRKKYHIPSGRLAIGVTVRSWLKGNAQARYEQAVASALDNIAEEFGAHILFIPQVTAAKGDDDRITSRRVYGKMARSNSATMVEDEPDHHQIKSIYDELDALLGTRFHSVIFSLTSYVPVLAIEYEHKTSGIMHDLGLDKWVIKIEDVVSTDLTAALRDLLQGKEQYKKYLHEKVPPYVQEARKTISMLEKSYQSHKGQG
ncbi:MAG TPA: polysaccharide pyruvyl transferase family protein [Candidatus Saccharimonadales bacterium]